MLPAKARFTRRAPVLALRPLALVFEAAALVAAGCGDEEGSPSGTPDSGSGSSLTIALDPDGPEGPDEERSEEVSCDGGNDPACAAIEDLEMSDFDATPPDQACTEVFGGPDIASIEGTIDGANVDIQLTRANGCEIERFDRAVPLLQALFEGYEPGAAIEGPVAG